MRPAEFGYFERGNDVAQEAAGLALPIGWWVGDGFAMFCGGEFRGAVDGIWIQMPESYSDVSCHLPSCQIDGIRVTSNFPGRITNFTV